MNLDDIATRGLLLLGCGKMGSAMLEGWLAGGLEPSAFTILDPAPPPRITGLAEQGLHLNEDPANPPAVVVLAVKPQMMDAALPRVTGFGNGTTLFLSIAAGTPLSHFEAVLGEATPVVRAMPNTPAAVGRGITAFIGNGATTEPALQLSEKLLSAVGETVRLDSEQQMDAVTAVSGSGPAYVFHLIEAMAAAGKAQGLPPELAETLARATVSGAGALVDSSDESAAQLRRNVTSPGGTTEAGLAVLMAEKGSLSELIGNAVDAASARSRELAS